MFKLKELNMFEPHKIKETQECKVFFTSDTHFCHDREFILSKRGYKNINEHDEGIIEKWNTVVRPTDIVVHCGDFLLGVGEKSLERFEEIANRLNGKIFYIWGNHNAGVKTKYKKVLDNYGFGKSSSLKDVYPVGFGTNNGSFSFVGYQLLLEVTTQEQKKHIFFCSHFAHRIWIDSHKGRVNHISGHSHGSDPLSQPDYLGEKRLDVGIENFDTPITVKQVVDIFDKKGVYQIDHHNETINPSF